MNNELIFDLATITQAVGKASISLKSREAERLSTMFSII
jgi:hypothetical protein